MNPDLVARAAFQERMGLGPLDAADKRMERFGAAHGITVVPMAPELGAYAVSHAVALHGFPETAFNAGHWNELGHGVAGRLIARELLARSPAVRSWVTADAAR